MRRQPDEPTRGRATAARHHQYTSCYAPLSSRPRILMRACNAGSSTPQAARREVCPMNGTGPTRCRHGARGLGPEEGMAVRDFVDENGVTWRVWPVTPDALQPRTAAED